MIESGKVRSPDPYLPYHLVWREAKSRGLPCKHYSLAARQILINGHRCQVVKARYFKLGKDGRHEAIPLYLPRSQWADFLIYVAVHQDNEREPSFFIVPRSETCRETGMLSHQNKFFKYKDEWTPLLADSAPLDDLQKPIETLNWKLKHVLSKAKSLGYQIELVPRLSNTRGGFIKNRIIINETKCQVMSASRLSNKPDDPFRKAINLHAPRDSWADFLIFILKPDKETFIIPRQRVPRSTTTLLTARWLLDYKEKWNLLASNSCNRKIDPELVTQSRHSNALQE